MANGRFTHPVVQGIESARGQFGDFFRSQSQVNLLQQEQQRQEAKEARKLYSDIIGTALTIDDPAQRLSFIRGMTSAMGMQLPKELDDALPTMAANPAFLKGMKRLDVVADAILEGGRGETAGQFAAGLPGAGSQVPPGELGAQVAPEEQAAVEGTFRRDIASLALGMAPSPRAAILAEEVRAQKPTQPLPEGLRKEIREIVTPPPTVEEQRRRLGPAPEGGKTEETTTVDEQGRPKVTRKTTTGEGAEKAPSNVTQLAWLASGPPGPGATRAQAALERMKKNLTSRGQQVTTTTFIVWATSDDPETRKRGERAIALWKGLKDADVVRAKQSAFKLAQERVNKQFIGLDPNDPKVKLALRQEYRKILEDFFGVESAGGPGGTAEGTAGEGLSSMSVEQLFNKANEGDEMAVEELIRRGEL